MEKPREEKQDLLIAKGKHEDGSDIEIYQEQSGGAYFVHKKHGGEIVEFSNLIPHTEEGEIRQYFSAKGIALTDDDVEKIKEELYRIRDKVKDEEMDAMLEAFNEEKATEQ